jgi:hypothetical protein
VTASDIPLERRPAIDVVRVAALVAVVVGHLLMAVVDQGPDGAVRGVNLLELEPGWKWLTLLSPMPLFFAAGGWANATSSAPAAARRLRPIVGLAAVVVGVWYLPAVVELVRQGERGVLGDGARLATQPVWFLAAYLPFAAAGSWLARSARRPVWSIGSCLVVLALADVARFALDAGELIGWVGFLPAWAVPWLLGAWWRQAVGGRSDARRFELARGVVLAGASLLLGAALVRWAGYSPTLVDAVAGDRSNTTPPTSFTAVAAVGQVGLLMIAAEALDRWGARWRTLVDRAAAVSVPVYLWHLTALALCSGLVAVGMPVPERLTVGWWLTRPLWWAAVLAVTGLLVVLTARGRTQLVRRHRDVPSSSGTGTMRIGVVVAAVGAAMVGLRGPASVALAAAALAALIAGWRMLRA